MDLNSLITLVNDYIWTYLLIALLIGLGLYFTIKSKFVQFRSIGEMIRTLGDGVTHTFDDNKKSISSFQAFCITTASRVGTGNLAGVATAIAIGGPASVFWMWLIALIGAASSFVESTLAQIYKRKSDDSYIGGPAYYMQYGLKKRWMGILFAILIIVTFGLVFNSVQSNTIAIAFDSTFGFDRSLMGALLAAISLIVIFGGIQRIAKVSSIIVPIMALMYIAMALFIIFTNLEMLPAVLSSIFKGALGLEPIVGGTIGAAIMQGIRRGLFSNEAGMGSAPNGAATADVTHPVKQGFIQTLGVFTDTLIICSCTAFIILMSDIPMDGSVKGIELTQMAITSHLGSSGGIFVAVAILLLAFSSIIGNYYYGEANILFITKSKKWLFLYRGFVGAMVFGGAIMSLDLVWNLADLTMALMAITNLIAIFLLRKIAFKALADYRAQKKDGIKSPVFKSSSIPELDEEVREW